jgi:hypothetical protein
VAGNHRTIASAQQLQKFASLFSLVDMAFATPEQAMQ